MIARRENASSLLYMFNFERQRSDRLQVRGDGLLRRCPPQNDEGTWERNPSERSF